MPKSEIKIDVSEVVERVQKMRDQVDRGAFIVSEKIASEGQSVMRVNAPWTDRTSNARNGLFGKAMHEKGISHTIVLYHTMPYGVFLETRNSGKYAVIVPTLQTMGPRTMNLLRTILAGG